MIGASPSLGSSNNSSGTRNRQHLLLAAGQPSGGPMAQRLQQREYVIDAADGPFILAVRAFLLADDEIVLHRMLGEDLAILGNKTEARAGDVMRLHARHGLAA